MQSPNNRHRLTPQILYINRCSRACEFISPFDAPAATLNLQHLEIHRVGELENRPLLLPTICHTCSYRLAAWRLSLTPRCYHSCTLVNHCRRLLLIRLENLMRLTIFDSRTRTCITTMVYSKGSIVLTHCPMSPLLLSRYHDKGKHVNGIEPSSSAWKADILTVVRHMRA